jgi:hypothetical protein
MSASAFWRRHARARGLKRLILLGGGILRSYLLVAGIELSAALIEPDRAITP